MNIEKDTKKELGALCNDYTDIFSIHAMGIGKTDLMQITLHPKDNIKPLDQKPYMLSLWYHAWL